MRANRTCVPPPAGAEKGRGVSGWRGEGRARVANLLHMDLNRFCRQMSGASASGGAGGGLEGLMLALRPGDEAMALELIGLCPELLPF